MPEPIDRPSLGQRLTDCLEEVAKLVDDAEFEAWIQKQPCHLCSLKVAPRGPSERHHTERKKGNRRSYLWSIPDCHRHHKLLTNEPYLEELLNLKKVARYYLTLFILEKFFRQETASAAESTG